MPCENTTSGTGASERAGRYSLAGTVRSRTGPATAGNAIRIAPLPAWATRPPARLRGWPWRPPVRQAGGAWLGTGRQQGVTASAPASRKRRWWSSVHRGMGEFAGPGLAGREPAQDLAPNKTIRSFQILTSILLDRIVNFACVAFTAPAGGTHRGHRRQGRPFKTLATALQAAGLVDTLKGKGPFTVFAPTDEAFAKIPRPTWTPC
jgi:hypothetical protein